MPKEDIKGLPDVEGLQALVQDEYPPEDKAPEPEPQQAQAEQPTDLGQFKSPEDVLKAFKEVQGFATKVSQENATLREQMNKFREQMEMNALMQQARPQGPAPQQIDDSAFFEKPADSARARSRQWRRRRRGR